MNKPRLVIEHCSYAPGEYSVTPDRLTLSIGFSRTPVEMRYDGRKWQGTSHHGDVKVMPEGQERLFRHRVTCRFARLTLDEDGLMENERKLHRPHGVLRDEPLRHLLNAIWAHTVSAPMSALFEHAMTQAILARLHALENHDERPLASTLSEAARRRVIDYLEANIAANVTVDSLANTVGLSTAHFAVLFRNTLGEPPHRYLTRLRVERARALLVSGMDPSEAAVAVGFYDHSHLARHMRRLLRITPSALRRNEGSDRRNVRAGKGTSKSGRNRSS